LALTSDGISAVTFMATAKGAPETNTPAMLLAFSAYRY
jgi:hypothetical protein